MKKKKDLKYTSNIKKKAANGTQVTKDDPGGPGTQGAMQLNSAPQTAESMTQQGQQVQQQMGTAYNPATDPYNPVNQTTPVNTPVANNNSNNSGNRFKFNPKFNSQKGGISTNGILAGGIQLFDSLLPYQKPKQNQNLYQQALQTNLYGTGSSATFADGGMIPAGNSGLAVKDGKYKHLSNDTIQLQGNTHEEGGTDIQYNGTPVEAETGETVHISPVDNSAIVGGNMYIPGSKTKYKKAFAEIGKVENKQQKIKNQADYFTTDFDPSVKASAATHNTGLVLQDAHVQHSAAIDTMKQQLTDMQNMQLKIMEKTGKKPEEVHKYLSGVARYGKTIKADGGTSIDENPKIPGVNYFGDSPNPNIKYNSYDNSQDPNTITQAPGVQPNYTSNVQENSNLAIPINNDAPNPVQTNNGYTPPKSNISGPIKGLRNKFRVLDYLPEISTLFDKPQPVQSVQETPLMESEYNISLQGKKNSIISSFKPALDATRNNPAQQAAISAQMAEQLAAVDGEEVNYNQQNAAGIRGRNLQELRNVRDINLRSDEDQLNKRSQAISNTKADQFRALESISDKEAKRRYSNNQLGLEENYTGWKYNPNNKNQMWQRTATGEYIYTPVVGSGINDTIGSTTTKKRTKSDNSGNTENTYEEDTKTAYLGGKIASRKPSSKEPSKGKKKLKYT